MRFELKNYSELTKEELYGVIRLRVEIFVVEQDCPYQDLDYKDQDSYHLFCKNEQNNIVAYTRLLPKGISYPDYCSIGRVVVDTRYRHLKLGQLLMEKSIECCRSLFKNQQIKISAQYYLLNFYSKLGFKEHGDQYLEDNIPHIAMIHIK